MKKGKSFAIQFLSDDIVKSFPSLLKRQSGFSRIFPSDNFLKNL